MRTWCAPAIVVCVVPLLAFGCARPDDDAAPVASAAVVLTRTSVPPGSPIDLTYTFTRDPRAAALPADTWVFLHVLDLRGELLWTDDHAPSTPADRWQPDMPVRYTRTMFVPARAPAGPMRIELGLFSRATGDRLPLAGRNRGMRAYDVGEFEVAADPNGLPLVFSDGWWNSEVGEGVGREWRWSKKEGRLTFANPHRPVAVFLQLDQPVTRLPAPQQVEIRGPGGTIESFPLPAGAPRVSRLFLDQGQLGTGPTVELVVAVDHTFVPAAVSGLNSGDTRELGVRVLSAAVEAK